MLRIRICDGAGLRRQGGAGGAARPPWRRDAIAPQPLPSIFAWALTEVLDHPPRRCEDRSALLTEVQWAVFSSKEQEPRKVRPVLSPE
jgi:hypothetical protein